MNPVSPPNDAPPAAIGIDLGGTRIKAAAFSADGAMLGRFTRPTQDFNDAAAAPAFAGTVVDLLKEIGAAGVPVGLAAPGLAARDGLAIRYMPGRLHGLEGLDWTRVLGRPARVLNDAHAALLGERWRGAARGLDDVVLITLGTGVGGAVVSGGRLLTGRLGRAGHLGHICLDTSGTPDITRIPGSLEDAIGECSLGARTGGRFLTTRDLLAARAAGDAGADRVWLESVRALGCAVASFVNIFDCEAVVLGGGVARAGDALFIPLATVLDEVEWRPGNHRARLLPAELGEWAGAGGAAWNAMHPTLLT